MKTNHYVTQPLAALLALGLVAGCTSNETRPRSSASMSPPTVADYAIRCTTKAVNGVRLRDGATVRIGAHKQLVGLAVAANGNEIVVVRGDAFVRVPQADLTACRAPIDIDRQSLEHERVCVAKGEPVAINRQIVDEFRSDLRYPWAISVTSAKAKFISGQTPDGRTVAFPVAARVAC